jgi:hypothetical protein
MNHKRVSTLGVLQWAVADHGAIVAGHNVDGWLGAMHDFAVLVTRFEDVPQDPGPPYDDLQTSMKTLMRANGYHLDPSDIYSMPIIAGGAVDPTVVPLVGDIVSYTHAGQNFRRTVHGVEEREDRGYYRLISQGA